MNNVSWANKLMGRSNVAYNKLVRVAQWIARLPPKQKVAGSTPASDAVLFLLLEN